MIRMNKLTDYGVVLLTTFAREPAQGVSARELSTRTGIPQPTVVKLLKTLLKAGLLVSQRGTKGGYALAKAPEEVPVSAIIEALEGPLAITECSTEIHDGCARQEHCEVSNHWPRINQAIYTALQSISLEEMSHPDPPRPVRLHPPQRTMIGQPASRAA